MEAETLKFDVAVIGGGSAGYAAARTARAAGKSVVVIEGGAEVGGLCILRGCMPTKALLHGAEVYHQAREAGVFGVKADHLSLDFPTLMAWKNRWVGEFAAYRRTQLQDGRFNFIRSKAVFEDPHRVRLADGGLVEADYLIIATGSRVAPPPIPSLTEVGVLTSDDILELQKLPASAIVLGGGAVAVELAQFLHRSGCETTLVQRSTQLLRDFDPDLAGALEQALRREGMHVHTGTKLLGAERAGDLRRVLFESGGQPMSVEAEVILHALGREPATDGLGLDRIGVTVEKGRIVTDNAQRTSLPHIFAAGDCCGPYEVVHIAIQQGETAAWNACHPETARTVDYRLVLTVVFTEPQVASVGLSEKEAARLGIPYRVASYPFNDHGKALLMNHTDGFVKLLTDPASGTILGGSVAGPVAGELIHEVVVAMAARMTAAQFAAVPHYHPTLAEIWTYPAEELA